MTPISRSGSRRCTVLLAAAGLLLCLPGTRTAAAGEARAAVTAAAPATITIHNFAFEPKVLTISAGTTVTWSNRDESPHTIAESGHAFRSAALDSGDKFTHTFATPGDFSYFCSIHPMMKGEIIVKPAP